MLWTWLYLMANLSGRRAFAMARPNQGPPGGQVSPPPAQEVRFAVVDRSMFKAMPSPCSGSVRR